MEGQHLQVVDKFAYNGIYCQELFTLMMVNTKVTKASV